METVVHADVETIRVAFNSNLKPYHFIDMDGVYKGMHIDMMNWIAKQKHLEVIYVPYETDYECINAINNNEVDVVLGHKTNDRLASGLQYTNELSSSTLCLVVPIKYVKDLGNAKDYRTYSAVIEYGTSANYNMTQMGIQRYLAKANQFQVLEALVKGQADMAIAVYDSSAYLLEEAGLKDRYSILNRYISPISHAMLVRKNDITLFNLMESGLNEMRVSGSYAGIYKQWQINNEQAITQELMRKIIIIFAVIACGIVIIIMFNIVINRMLKKKVAEKTKELNDTNIELDKRMIQIQSDSRIYYGMIEFSPSGMVSFDTNYRILLINHAALHMGDIKDNCLGSDVRNLNVFGDILKNIKYDIFSLNNYSKNVSHPIIIELGEAENKRSYRYSIYNSYDENGINSILLNVEDVTAEERKKQELFENEKSSSINRLAAGIAHEIKNPLMSISTMASLLKTQGKDPEVQEAIVKFVPNEVNRINQLIEGLISYARPVKGKRETVNLADVIRECLYLTKIASKQNNICYETDLDDSVEVFVNRDKIKQSLINIILNGIESMKKKLQREPDKTLLMTIRIYKDMEFVWVSVRDEGVGMSEPEINRCMEPFYTTKTVGTGLGLALVNQFMIENDGMIEIHSEIDYYTEILLRFRRSDKDETQNTNN
jgi:polar amino acid transport system substrate-binding protein